LLSQPLACLDPSIRHWQTKCASSDDCFAFEHSCFEADVVAVVVDVGCDFLTLEFACSVRIGCCPDFRILALGGVNDTCKHHNLDDVGIAIKQPLSCFLQGDGGVLVSNHGKIEIGVECGLRL
jgi:hypothetical protein